MDNDFVRALTETMIVDNERMWDRIFKRIQKTYAFNAFNKRLVFFNLSSFRYGPEFHDSWPFS